MSWLRRAERPVPWVYVVPAEAGLHLTLVVAHFDADRPSPGRIAGIRLLIEGDPLSFAQQIEPVVRNCRTMEEQVVSPT